MRVSNFVLVIGLVASLLPGAGCDQALVGDELCGNGKLDPGELCDTGLQSGPDACPVAGECDDGAACTQDALEGEGCAARCTHTAITQPADGDGCCPDGASFENDADCPPGCGDDTCDDDETCAGCPTDCGVCCGNGRLDPGEECDPQIVGGPGQCPVEADCDDGFDCTLDSLAGQDCTLRCEHEAIGDLIDGDGCCPPGAIHAEDADCAIRCDDGQCEGDEDCENCPVDCGDCPPECPADPLVPDGSVAQAGQPCEAQGTLACAGHAQGGVLECAAETCTWTSTQGCSGGYLCDSADAVCRAPVAACIGHQPGDVVCDGPDRHVCGPDLVSSQVTTCGSAQLCQLGDGAACAVCLDGQYRCVGAELEICAADHAGFDPVQTCASADLCNAGAGECTDQVCVAGQHRCTGDDLEVCDGIGSGFDFVATCDPGLCDPVAGECDVCEPLTTECADPDTYRSCAADGQAWNETDCPAQTPFCIDAGTCVQCQQPADCPPTGNPCLVPTCDANVCGTRTLDPGEACGTGAICDDQAACVCDWGFGDCDADMGDGCETDLWSDGENCNACDRSCQGGACSWGECQPVSLAQASFSGALAQDADHLYTREDGSWSIVRIPKAGGAPLTIADAGGSVRDIEVDFANVYWINLNEIYKASKSGGSRTYLADADGGRIALSDDYVFYTVIFGGVIRQVGKWGSSAWDVVTGQPVFDGGPTLTDLEIADGQLWWAIDANSSGQWGGVRNSSLYGEDPTDLTTGLRVGEMASDANGIYWVDSGNGIYSYTFADGQIHALSEGLDNLYYITFRHIAVDDEYVYYAAYYHNAIIRAAKDGSGLEWVATGLTGLSHLTVDDSCVYFIDEDGLQKVVKPQ